MADFTSIKFDCNTGTNGAPTWTDIAGGSNKEVRFHDTSSAGLATASASWPSVTRPAAVADVPYQYAFTADTTGLGIIDAGSNVPTSFVKANYLHSRWNWDAVGTFASAPIFTAYPTTGHGAITRGDGTPLGGHTTDTGGTARSYVKANAFGRVVTAGAPAAAPSNNPAATDGSTGAATPSAGANWLANFQGLQGDNDWIAFPSTPAATTADQWNTMFDYWIGPNITAPATYTIQFTLKYTYS